MPSGMKLVVTGGGTGGHIYPALAVAETLKSDPGIDSITYIGKTGGLENELVPQADISFEGIAFYGMPRGLTPLLPFKLLAWGWKLQGAIKTARQKLKSIQPHVVFGTGGYVSAPVLMAAKSLGIPYVLHEPDALPGLVNRLMSRDAAVITTSFSEGAEKLKHSPKQQVLVTGNPIRGEIGKLSKTDALTLMELDWDKVVSGEKPVLLVTGGSQGARRINQAVVEALPVLLNELNLAVIHITGRKLYDETLQLLQTREGMGETTQPSPDGPTDAGYPESGTAPPLKHHPYYKPLPYSSNMAALLALADLALCRAGSLSLSEMYVCGIPTVLVPYPYAAADHQRKNAMASVRSGASLMIEDSACTGEEIVRNLRPLMENREKLAAMQASARALGHPDATRDIIACLRRFGP